MTGILDKIFADKAEELEAAKRKTPLKDLKDKIQSQREVKNILPVLRKEGSSRIIAEIKRRTPFLDDLRKDFDPVDIADVYADNGAAAISVLTESTHFGGHLDFLEQIHVGVPLLRKDFLFDEYQVYESRAWGADFFLLIATQLEKNHIADLMGLGKELHLTALVETHTEWDMEKAIEAEAALVGINNRDLKTGKTDLNIARRLVKMGNEIPDIIMVCESGINSRREIEEFEALGIHAFLIGGSLMKSDNIPEKLKDLLGYGKTQAAG